jgi:thiol-disulfide isomerase/thioredoxin
MTKIVSVLCAVALLVLVVLAVAQAHRSGVSAAPAVAVAAPPAGAPAASVMQDPGVLHVRLAKHPQPVPAFAVTTFDGRRVTSASLRGKVVILNFWATWCGPCRLEIPSFIELQKKYPDELVILGASIDETGEATVRRFVTDHAMTYAVAIAPQKMQDDFGGIDTLPTTYLLDREGNVEQKHVGLYGADEFEVEVRALAGLPINAVVERTEEFGEISVEHAAEANAIPGVDLSKLTPEQKATALERLNTEHCTCGCNRTLARCRLDDPTCETSLPLAKKVVEDIRAGRKGGG